jgi:hypothetical protein
MNEKIKCDDCEYARQDKNASVYSRKTCGKCELWEDCEVCRGCKKRADCKACKNQKNKQSCGRRQDTMCSNQTLVWAAIECANPDSEYHKALLNVTPNGDKQNCVTWCGCSEGERRLRGVAR